MLVYHGSNSNFKTLRISKTLVKHRSTELNEGLGIYFSTDYDIAASYGKYIYSLSINDSKIWDFRDRNTVNKYMKQCIDTVRKRCNVDISCYIVLEDIAQRLNYGGIGVAFLGREIWLNLENTELFYKGLSSKKRNSVMTVLRHIDSHLPDVYMFNYSIKNVGIIKNVSPEVVQIVNKERL